MEKIKNGLLNTLKSPEESIIYTLFRGLLWIPSQFYAFTVKFRFFLFKFYIFHRTRLSCPVISVGNITVGGTGKTPFVKYIAEKLRKKGYKVAILSRGYKKPLHDRRKSRLNQDNSTKLPLDRIPDVTVVSNFEQIQSNWYSAGDEPYLLAQSLPGIAVLVGPNRKKTGKYAINELGANIIILDDGFSHLQLRRDIDLVLLDLSNPFGYGYCLPRGLLREPLSGLKRADGIILTRPEPDKDYTNFFTELHKYAPGVPVFKSKFTILGLTCLVTCQPIFPEGLGGKRVFALSGIGNPESSERNLRSLNLDIRQHIIYPDHYIYEKENIELVREYIQKEPIDYVITTTKDAIKIKPFLTESDIKWHSMEIDVDMPLENQFWDFMGQKLQGYKSK